MFTNPFAPLVGGTEKSVATFSEDLRALGHEVLVVTGTGVGNLPSDQRNVLRVTSWRRGTGDVLSGALDRFRPDLIHAHQPFLLGEEAFRQARLRQVPLVFTHHTLYDREPDRVSLGELGGLEEAVRRLAVLYSNHCEAVIAPTPSIALLLQEQGVDPIIEIVPTGIDTARFASGLGDRFRDKHGISREAFVVGHLGRLVPAKRVGFLAEAVSVYLSGSGRGHALVCGEGTARGEIIERFTERGITGRLTMTGNLSDEEIADAYAAMDVFVFASLTETQGIVLLEAMAAGVPVLALRATGPQDVVSDVVCGRLLEPGTTPAAFAEVLAEFESSPETTGFARAAADHAASFDRRRCAEALAEVYGRVLREFEKGRGNRAIDPDLETRQREVESEWRRLMESSSALRELLPTRGFPGFVE